MTERTADTTYNRPRAGERFVFLTGPCDAAQALDSWLEDASGSAGFGDLMLQDFFSAVRDVDGEFIVINPGTGGDRESERGRVIETRPRWNRRSGVLFHAGQVLFLLGVIVRIARWRPDHVIIAPFRPYWFLFTPLSWLGIDVIASVHGAFWPKLTGPTGATRRLLPLNRRFLRRHLRSALTASADCEIQLSELAGGQPPPMHRFLPVYPVGVLDDLEPPAPPTERLNLLLVTTLYAAKGWEDVLDAIVALPEDLRARVRLDVCGSGEDMARAEEAATRRGLGSQVEFHGFCDLEMLRRCYDRAHVSLIPTRRSLQEGFNRVLVESIVANRVVVATTSAVPDDSGLDDAVVTVEPDDPVGLSRALAELAASPAAFTRRLELVRLARDRFMDADNSYRTAFLRALEDSNR